ncbi:MAG: hypothetical protein WCY24_00625 [Lutispora sp.]|nr:hypothetical protein [Lutispora sp.]MDD4833153.1 hypothetical protein [Lutispora sp.]
MKISFKKHYAFYTAAVALALILTMTFYGRISNTVTVFQANIELEKMERQGYKSYNVLDGTFKFSIPASWHAWEQKFVGGEIVYHLNFITPNKKIHGFIQAWKMDKPLEKFLEESKKSAVGPVDFKTYSSKEIMVNRNKGFLVQYERAKETEGYYKAYEAFLEDGKGMIYRASFFTDEKDWRNYYPLMYNRIIQSFKIK